MFCASVFRGNIFLETFCASVCCDLLYLEKWPEERVKRMFIFYLFLFVLAIGLHSYYCRSWFNIPAQILFLVWLFTVILNVIFTEIKLYKEKKICTCFLGPTCLLVYFLRKIL